jgi:hypothetical protein
MSANHVLPPGPHIVPLQQSEQRAPGWTVGALRHHHALGLKRVDMDGIALAERMVVRESDDVTLIEQRPPMQALADVFGLNQHRDIQLAGEHRRADLGLSILQQRQVDVGAMS